MAKYNWTYTTMGGTTRVKIQSGEDIRHLGELDEKQWTVLSCPVVGLEIPEESLKLVDLSADGKIHIQEVVATADWLCSVLKDPNVLVTKGDSLRVDAIADSVLQSMAQQLASDGVVTVDNVKSAIAAVTVESQAVPEAPYTADVIAAYKACSASYSSYFDTMHLQSMGLAKVADDAVVPGMTEEAFKEMGSKIAAYEAEVANVTAANAGALSAAQAQYQPLLKLLLLRRDFYTLLRNFVSFQDFYAKRSITGIGTADKDNVWAIFQAGTLVIDQRACHLCLRVSDMGKHDAQAAASGMFLIYCNCTLQKTGEKMQIVAAMTVGDIRHLKVGKNALFYDRQGRDWDAEVVKIVDNPISISQAFWSPYRKFGDWVVNLINKSAAEKDTKAFSDVTAKIQDNASKTPATDEKGKAQAFDIAKFAGIFAAIGMAVGYIGAFFTSVIGGFANLTWWQDICAILGILLVISGPSMIMAWFKLRKRNLAPLLNANGWAINADAIVSVMFGGTLTEQAQFPLLKAPKSPKKLNKKQVWALVIAIVIVVVAIVCGVMWALGYRPCCCC